MTVAVSGAPANGDQFQIAPSTPTLGSSTRSTGHRRPEDARPTGAQIAQANGDGLRDIDAVLGNLQAARSRRRRGAQPDRQRERSPRRPEARQRDRAIERGRCGHGARDLRFQNRQSGYDAALKSYAMVQRLSLFQYVNGG